MILFIKLIIIISILKKGGIRMKTLGKLKLTQLNSVELRKNEMGQLVGGESCGCGCNGSSSTDNNANANWNSGYSISGGGATQCASWGQSSWGSNF